MWTAVEINAAGLGFKIPPGSRIEGFTVRGVPVDYRQGETFAQAYERATGILVTPPRDDDTLVAYRPMETDR